MLDFICIMTCLTEKYYFIKENTIRGQIIREQTFLHNKRD